MINITKIKQGGIYSCWACEGNTGGGFTVWMANVYMGHTISLCPKCFQELQAKISPLAILVQTGVNTK